MKHIKKLTQDAWIDLVAFIAFVFLAATGVMLRYILPPGSGRITNVWGLDRHEWGTVHFWISIVFFSVMALHLIWHWKWIVCVIKGKETNKSGVRMGLGLMGLLVVIILALSPILSPVEKGVTGAGNTPRQTEVKLAGYMSLQDVSQQNNIPVKVLVKELGLSANVDPTETIGRIRKTYGLEMDDIRQVIAKNKDGHSR